MTVVEGRKERRKGGRKRGREGAREGAKEVMEMFADKQKTGPGYSVEENQSIIEKELDNFLTGVTVKLYKTQGYG